VGQAYLLTGRPGVGKITLARVGRGGGPRVGKYRIDLEALDRVGVPAIVDATRSGRLVVIDEIGKMEMA
jgi:nucleoside-triphosphatase